MSDWISYKGIICPVEKDVLIDVTLKNGDILTERFASEFDWELLGRSDAILKYRIVDEVKKFTIGDDLILDELPSKITQPEHTGLSVSYYDVTISEWTNPDHQEEHPVTVSCNDILEALNMNYACANVFKAIWRICAAKQGKLKKGNNTFYDAEKVSFFSKRILIQEQKNEL